jgi:hypothetical protein
MIRVSDIEGSSPGWQCSVKDVTMPKSIPKALNTALLNAVTSATGVGSDIGRPLLCHVVGSCLGSIRLGLGQFWHVFQPQCVIPRFGKSTRSPVAYNALPYTKGQSQLTNAAFGINCSFEDVHKHIINTFVFNTTPT